MRQLRSGQPVGHRYMLDRPLGRGGMSEAWLAKDLETGSEVVLKMAPENGGTIESALLEREFKLLCRLDHPNIVRGLDFGRDAGFAFLALEHLAGGDARQLRERSLSRILAELVALADALSHAHERGVTHRDLKVANVLLDSQGQAHLVDFGIGDSQGPGPTVVGGGSPTSSSPQQLSGLAPQPADDIYSFGVLIWDLFLGVPSKAESPQADSPKRGPTMKASATTLDKLLSLASDLTQAEPAARPENMLRVRQALQEIALGLQDKDQPIGEQPAEATLPPTLVRPPLKLTPPPRLQTGRPNAAPHPGSATGGGTSNPKLGALTAIAFAVLIFAVAGVFLLLPKWVDQRETSKAERSTEATAAASPPSTPNESAAAQTEPSPVTPATVESPAVEQPEIQRPNPEPKEASPGFERTSVLPAPSSRPATSRQGFSRLMSEGLAALDRQDYAAATVAFHRAQELDPGSSQANQGLARALAGAKVQEIATHRSEANRKEDLEDWPSTAREYEAVLALDPAIRFAQIGLERARDRASLHERLEYHLANPGRLASPEVHESTTDLLAEAQTVDSPGALLTDQITRLTEQLQVAATPVTVWLESDNLTRVVVYRVGDLGKFQRRSVDLRPGIYTVVGTRDGYRDVRLRLEVVPGRAIQPLVVRCKEAI